MKKIKFFISYINGQWNILQIHSFFHDSRIILEIKYFVSHNITKEFVRQAHSFAGTVAMFVHVIRGEEMRSLRAWEQQHPSNCTASTFKYIQTEKKWYELWVTRPAGFFFSSYNRSLIYAYRDTMHFYFEEMFIFNTRKAEGNNISRLK